MKREHQTMTRKTTRREFLGATGAAGLAMAAGANRATAVEKRPNILLIMTDQQPLDCVSAYGNREIETPAADKLAREGCLLRQAYLSGFPCTPSRASLLTGQHVHHHQVVNNDVILDADTPALGDVCKDAGYNTGYFGKWHLGGWMHRGHGLPAYGDNMPEFHFDVTDTGDSWKMELAPGCFGEDEPQHGFDTWYGGWKQYRDWLRDEGLGEVVDAHPNLGCHNILPPGNYDEIGVSGMSAEHHVETFIANRACDFLEQQASTEKPWCAVVSFYGPHPPVAPPKPYDQRYDRDKLTLPESFDDPMESKPPGQRKGRYIYGKWSEEKVREYIALYYGFTTFVDEQMGRVLEALEETGQVEDTVVLFTSDHGNMNGHHGMHFKTHGTGYEELFHVPAMLRIPGVTKAGQTCDALVSQVDLLPTLLAAAGLEAPEGEDGKNLLPVLSEKTEGPNEIAVGSGAERYFVMRSGPHKFVLHFNGDPEGIRDELYDLEEDPHELQNLAYTEERLAQRLRERVVQWLHETKHPHAAAIEQKAFAGRHARKT